jgi:hypothetical protein
MVPIKDPSFIGRKIDCPKCKYRFVVEDPGTADEESDVEEAVPAKRAAKGKAGGTAVTTKRAVNGKAATVKKKPGLKARSDDDDDDEEAAPAKKKSGGSMTLILGIGLGGVAIVLLVIGLIVILSSGGTTTKPKSPTGPSTTPAADAGDDKKDETSVSLVDITNLLPNEAEAVLSVNVDRLMASALNRAVFASDFSPGGFRQEEFQRRWGFPLGDVSRMVDAANTKDSWHFGVVRTKPDKPKKLEDLVKALGLVKDVKSPIGDYEFFTVTGDLDSFSRFILMGEKGKKALSFHLYDANTLVFADVGPMQKFLEAKRAPQFLSQAPASGSDQNNPGTGAPGGMPGMMPGGNMPPGKMPANPGNLPSAPGGQPSASGPGTTTPHGGQPGDTPTPPSGQPSAPGGTPSGPPGVMPPVAGQGGGMPGGMPGGGMPFGGNRATETPSSSYMTIKPALKLMMDRIEDAKTPGVLSVVQEVHAEDALLKQAEQNEQFESLLRMQQNLQELNIVGLSLQQLTTTKLTGAVGIEFKTEEVAKAADKGLKQVAPLLAGAIGQELGIKIKVGSGQGTGTGPGMMPGGSGPPGGMGPGMGPGGMYGPPGGQTGPGGAQYGPPQPGGSGPPGGMGPGMGPGGMGPGGMGPGGQPADKSDEPSSTINTVLKDNKSLIITVDLTLTQNASDKIVREAAQGVMRFKGQVDMSSGKSHLHDLAAALKAYTAKTGQFPRGTVDRPPGAERAGLPWPPNQRVSWMAELLPYLGGGEYDSLARQIKNDKSWREDENLLTATTLVPYFLAPDYPADTWWVTFPGVAAPVANTHFVGVSGIGPDAAEYAATDPAVAKKLGVFGNDRQTRLSDIKDGPENTIALIQVPADYKAPWLAGGGATIRGVPETDSIKPFVCVTYQGKRGTYAIMADSKVRFIAETIADKDFQALVTIAGGEKVDVDALAPVVPGQTAELKAQPLPETAPPAKEEPKAPPGATVPAPAPAPMPPKTDKGGVDTKVLTALNNNCAACHTGASAKKNVRIFASEGVLNADVQKDKLSEVLASGKMPPRNRPRPSAEDMQALQDWLNGAK